MKTSEDQLREIIDCDSSLGFLNGDPLNASEINVVVSGQMTGIMRFRETGLLSYA